MDFNGLQTIYWQQQIARVDRVREQVAARLNITAGRTIPDSSDLAIATGRRLSVAIMFLDFGRGSCDNTGPMGFVAGTYQVTSDLEFGRF